MPATGPRTPEGKARSSRNALKHGLTAAQLVVRPEERDLFDDFLCQYEEEFRPQGMLEQTLFDLLVHAAWNLRRIRTLEARMIGEGMDPFLDEENSAAAHRLERYAQRYERSFYKALKELRAVQATRQEQEEEPFEESTKRTPDPQRPTPDPQTHRQTEPESWVICPSPSAAQARLGSEPGA